ncbi:cytochrome P450 4V2 [Nephila pilipes]|uniref:Cytochrome P450 4V2 n=1 Tax=Nephila pilipes TaxID=299642 RepID=A0A8X6NHM4_NEPPI|nr:cytochrome P450 4V2 [Nephila pilipes]
MIATKFQKKPVPQVTTSPLEPFIPQLLSKGTRANEKSWTYDFMKPLMGTGLVTSSLDKWKGRRKLLTPCFHADILRGFLTVFNENSQKLVEHLRQETKKEFTYIGTPVTLTALDIICERVEGALSCGCSSWCALQRNHASKVKELHHLFQLGIWQLLFSFGYGIRINKIGFLMSLRNSREKDAVFAWKQRW